MQPIAPSSRLEADRGNGHLAPLDPRVTQHLCAALQAIGSEQGRPGSNSPAGASPRPKGLRVSPQLWSSLGALLLTGAAFAGLVVYQKLGDDLGDSRGKASTLRRELAQYRSQFVRKDEVGSRNLAIHALLQDTQSKTKAAMDVNKDRFQEHKLALRDFSLQVKEMRLEMKRLEDRLAVREKREGIVATGEPANGR
jgi:hypothetical protein